MGKRRLSFHYEVPLFFLVLTLINYYVFSDHLAFIGISPHPYWIGIIIFSKKYGFPAGVYSGLVAAALYLVLADQSAPSYFFEDYSNFTLPAFFVLGGFVFGWIFSQHFEKTQQLVKEKEELNQEKDRSNVQVSKLEELKIELENKVITQMSSLVTLYEGARMLESFEINNVYKGALDFTAKLLSAEEACIYEKTEQSWKMKVSKGWSDSKKHVEKMAIDEGLVGLAASRRKLISIRDIISDKKSKKSLPKVLGDSMICAPLYNGENGEVVAVLAIQKIPFLKFNSSSINLLSFLSKWVSRAIGRSKFIYNLQNKTIIDTNYNLYNENYFNIRLKEEFARSKKYSLPLTIALFKIENVELLEKEMRENLYLAFTEILKRCCREIDIVAKLRNDLNPFVILFNTASKKQVNEIRDEVLEAYDELQLAYITEAKHHLKIGVCHYKVDIMASEDMIAAAKQELM